ncbi:nucleotidyltransferase domain-containing protein [Bifidobacterium gallicum]|uniref:Protein-P-II uridylyltransferase n=1 Tax=Bifidobacterium gallicum DSM 20093 = LMG 11596 TaxID=561180 RepID=D1NW00_9BIFI|nr:nucleotidyltransferase domain-containing protein [Bifidobacterium gallicum]EFA22286.1 putative protein-P-II uridylyltransferase [Bifidobacterium gallicum DSM 20093 = LMG 11596]KFI60013.1 protein-P-II uridylyltransferase [Bifidobacterium gallicum DSM 20093 = LMG 11596]
MTSSLDGLKDQLLTISRLDDDGVYRNGAAKRAARTEAVECALRNLWQEAVDGLDFDVPTQGIGLAAVGSLARGQIGPYSDLDLVIIHDPHALSADQLNMLANAIWYPIWDAGLDLDHSVRTRAQCQAVTDHDLPAAMGWLDVKPLAGDAEIINQTALTILERWRKAARQRLPELLESAKTRLDRFGRLPYVNQPDVKEARGGLRDAVLLEAIAASWLADRPHGRYDVAFERLLDARDAIHLAARKDTNLLLSAYQAPVAAMLGLADPTLPQDERAARSIDDLQTMLARLGRTIAFSLDSTASRAQRTLPQGKPRFSFFQIRHPRAQGKREAPKFETVAPGLALHEGEIVLAPDTDVTADSALALRAAVQAAQHACAIHPTTLANLAQVPMRDHDWNDEMRALLLELLGSGDRLLPVWESLDFAGIPARMMPEWEAIRNRPSASAAHRYTIDRHMVEVTSRLTRTRPVELGAGGEYDDAHYTALLLAGILHDIGKRPGIDDHAAEGMRHARVIVERLGYGAQIADWVTLLVQLHLKLSEAASSASPQDQAVTGALAEAVRHDAVLLDMLFDLTRADMNSLGATSGETISGRTGWSSWQSSLVTTMARAVRRQCK